MKKYLAILLSLTFCTFCFMGCGSKNSDDGPIYIGSIDPLTGAVAIFGQDATNGKELAVEELNANGGILGREVILLKEDDGGQPAQTTTVATKLITNNKVNVLLGSVGSSSTLALVDVVEEYEVPLVAYGGSSPKITAVGCDWLIRMCADDNLQARMLVKYAHDQGIKKLGFIYSNEDFGVGGYNVAVEAAEDYNMELVAESFMLDDQNFSAQLSKLKDAGIECLLMWSSYSPSSLIAKQIKEMGWEIKTLSSSGLMNTSAFELSDNGIDGIIMTTTYYPSDKEERVAAWTQKYVDTYGFVPTQTAAYGYDAVMVYAQAVETAGTTDPEKVMEALRGTKDFKSLKGLVSINPENGEYQSEVRLVIANAETQTFDYLDTVEFE